MPSLDEQIATHIREMKVDGSWGQMDRLATFYARAGNRRLRTAMEDPEGVVSSTSSSESETPSSTSTSSTSTSSTLRSSEEDEYDRDERLYVARCYNSPYPWMERNMYNEGPGDICCQRAAGEFCYQHNRDYWRQNRWGGWIYR